MFRQLLGLQTVLNGSIPNSFIPDDLTKELKTDKYEMLIFMSEYKTGSDEANNQCNEIEKIIKNYSKDGMLVGEAACTRDLIKITDKDFTVVNSVSIVLVFIIIALVFKSISIPIVLVALMNLQSLLIWVFHIIREQPYHLLHQLLLVQSS